MPVCSRRSKSGFFIGETLVKWVPVASFFALASCTMVPGNGPVASTVLSASANGDEAKTVPPQKLTFEVVNIDGRIASLVTAKRTESFKQTFGFGGGITSPVIGVGDTVDVTIFEASANGLFSTADNKSKTIPVVVQPNGHGQIPYVGSVRLAGLSLDSARQVIIKALQQKAVEPDVTLSVSSNTSRSISVMGSVNDAKIIPMPLSPLKVTDALAYAGGPQKSAYDCKITMIRGKRRSSMPLQMLLDNPSDNIYLRPGDQLFVTYDPRTFTALGSTASIGTIPFNTEKLSLVEASAMAGGSNPNLADPSGYFVFRYEAAYIYRRIVGDKRFSQLLANGMRANDEGFYPIVYRLDLNNPQNYLIAQNFPVENKDVIYLSRHPAADILKFVGLASSSAGLAYNATNTLK
jgi:polysaccharide biosynthesis/export protein